MRNIKELVELYLDNDNLEIIKKIGYISEKNNFTSYIVGGLVRDIIRGELKDIDIDIVTEQYAPELAKYVAKELKGELVVHEKYGTAKVKISKTKNIDFTTARTEIYEKPADYPQVSFSNIKNDLFRRDFTINSMAISINKHSFGDLIDLFDGYNDIKEKKIKILHDKSFIDDPNRIFRAVRFKQKLGFEIEDLTKELAIKTIEMGIFDYFINDRIKNEIKISFSNDYNPIENIKELYNLNTLRLFCPEIDFIVLEKELINLYDNIVFFDEKLNIKANEWVLYLSLIINKIDKKENFDKIVDLIRFEKTELTFLNETLNYNNVINILSAKNITNYEIYSTLKKLSHDNLIYIISLSGDSYIKTLILKYITELKDKNLILTGNDLIKLGFKQGSQIGLILDKLKEEKINSHNFTHEDEINFVKTFL
ncbi:MAG: hypothetical protein AABZ74_00720 [Cyanobacteriota bacterium]